MADEEDPDHELRNKAFDMLAEHIDDLPAEALRELNELLAAAEEDRKRRGVPDAKGPEDSTLWDINQRRAKLGKPPWLPPER